MTLARQHPDVWRSMGEAGVSPALSRNGNSRKMLKPEYPPIRHSITAFAQKGVRGMIGQFLLTRFQAGFLFPIQNTGNAIPGSEARARFLFVDLRGKALLGEMV